MKATLKKIRELVQSALNEARKEKLYNPFDKQTADDKRWKAAGAPINWKKKPKKAKRRKIHEAPHNAQRVATVKSNGDKYLVLTMNLDKGTVTCWGDVTAYRGGSTTHEDRKVFPRAEVDIAEYHGDRQKLAQELLSQTRRHRAQQPRPEPAARAPAFNDQDLGHLRDLMRMANGGGVSRGGGAPVDKAATVKLSPRELEQIESQGWTQARRGSEFIERSAVFAKTPEDARSKGNDFDVLSNLKGRVYRDPSSGLFWRDTGSFD